MMRDKNRWASLEAENQAELLAYLGTAPCTESYSSAEITWVITGVDSNDYNGVLWSRLSNADADQQIPALIQRFRERHLPALWHIDEKSQPGDLAERLAQLGCYRLGPGVCMAAPLDSLHHTIPTPSGLTIEHVRTEGDLADWIEVWAQDNDERHETRKQLYSCLGLGEGSPIQHFIARLNGQPVGISQLFLGKQAAGLYSVAVLPMFQRRGIGSALTLAPFTYARKQGYTLGVLGPSPEGQPMYRRLGFELFASPFVGYALWLDHS